MVPLIARMQISLVSVEKEFRTRPPNGAAAPTADLRRWVAAVDPFETDVWTITLIWTGIPDEPTVGPSRPGYDSEGGLNRFSRYEADFRSQNLDGDHGRRTHEDLGQQDRLPDMREARNNDFYHEDTRLPERGHRVGYPEEIKKRGEKFRTTADWCTNGKSPSAANRELVPRIS